jgi:hypothetical protein
VSQSGSTGYAKGKGRGPEPMVAETTDSYTFPPQPAPSEVRLSAKPDLVTRKISPSNSPNSQTGSPVPFHEGRRLSVSSVRFERRPSPSAHGGEKPEPRTIPSHLSSGPSGPKSSRSPINSKASLPKPETQRHHSHPSPSSEGQQQQSLPTKKSLGTADRRRELRDLGGGNEWEWLSIKSFALALSRYERNQRGRRVSGKEGVDKHGFAKEQEVFQLIRRRSLKERKSVFTFLAL